MLRRGGCLNNIITLRLIGHLMRLLKCKRMRKMVIRRLKEAGFTKSTVNNNYTPDDKVNDWLLKEW